MTRIIKRLSISFEKLAWKMEQKGIMLYYFDQNTNLIVFRQKCSFCRSFWFFALILSCSLLFTNQIICRSFTKKEQKKAKRAKKVQIILWSNNRAYHNNDLNKPIIYIILYYFIMSEMTKGRFLGKGDFFHTRENQLDGIPYLWLILIMHFSFQQLG